MLFSLIPATAAQHPNKPVLSGLSKEISVIFLSQPTPKRHRGRGKGRGKEERGRGEGKEGRKREGRRSGREGRKEERGKGRGETDLGRLKRATCFLQHFSP